MSNACYCLIIVCVCRQKDIPNIHANSFKRAHREKEQFDPLPWKPSLFADGASLSGTRVDVLLHSLGKQE